MLTAAAVIVVGVLIAGVALMPWRDRTEQVSTDGTGTETSGPERDATPTDTTPPGNAAEPAWTGLGFSELPPSGIAIAKDGELVLYDFEGDELAQATTPAVAQLPSSPERLLAAVRPGDTIDAIPADLADAPADCESAATAGGIRVALCGGEPQQRQRIESISPTGAQEILAEAPDGSHGLGHWRSAVPSPDGRWVLATWSGECESPTTFLIATDDSGPLTTIDGHSGLGDAAESSGIGWSSDGSAIVHFHTGLCGQAVPEPGVYLVNSGSLNSRLVIPQPEPGNSVHLWRSMVFGNDAEWIIYTAIEQLDLEGCCGEPSHGGFGLTAGATWQDFDIPIGATPPGETETVPINDLVLSSEPITLGDVPAIAGEADLGPFVSYTCGNRIWTFGGAGMGDRANTDATAGLAAAVLPYLGCTVGDRPLAPGHGPGGP